MRKKIALFLAAIMVVGTLPMTAFAGSDNEIDRVATVQDGTVFTSELIIDDLDTDFTTESIKLTLTNAEWAGAAVEAGDFGTVVDVDDYSKTKAFVDFKADVEEGKAVLLLTVKAKGEGEATVTIEDVKSDVTEETLKIANIIDDATITTIDGTKALQEGETTIKDIVIEEVVAGSIEEGTIKFRLAGGFEWAEAPAADQIKFKYAGTLALDGEPTIDGRDLYVPVKGSTTNTEAVIVFNGLVVEYDADDVDFGTDCEVVITGAGVDKTTLLVGTASDYAVTFTVEDEELPVVWAGEEDETETLEVTIKEKIANSWIHERVAKITFPEGIKVVDAQLPGEFSINKDLNVITVDYPENWGTIDEDYTFEIVAAADFEGDVEVTLSGSATGADEQTVVVATVAKKWAVEADTNELIIDYRNTAAGDIVITEAEAGLWEKGEVIALALDKIAFEGKPSVTVEEGDMKIKNVEENNGVISFEVKQESIKDAAVIRISGIELYMGRALAAGEYDLSIIATGDDDVAFENDYVQYATEDEFEVEEMVVCEGFVTIVTAGREQDDSTFTTKVVVTIGAATMTAGSKVIALDVPAFIDGGYTMLPVRAVAESLSDAAIVKWDDATKTVVIFFGQRTISMTIGSKVMVINGVDIAMSAAPVIVNGRTFLPLRDLGYALGLNEDKIAWDDATKTATLN